MAKVDFLITRDRCRAAEGNEKDIHLVKTFIKKGYSSGMISCCQRIHSRLKKEGIFSAQMLEMIRVPSRLENMEERAARIENEYQIPSLKRFIFPEKCYYQKDENYLLRKAVVYFEGLEKFFDENEIKCLIQAQGGQINTRTLYFIAQKRGIPVFYTHEHLFPDKMLLFSDEMKNQFKFKNFSWEEMTKQQRQEIEVHIKQFRGGRRVVSYSLVRNRKDKAVRNLIGLQEYIQNRQFNGLKDAFWGRLKKIISENANRFFSRFLYQSNIKDEKFIYFPLHVPNDSEVTIRNTQFYDQASLAVYIARSLPFGYKLYVKEHPHPASLLSVRDKKRIVKEKNAVMLEPKVNSHKVMEKSEAVIVISSTVGLEALHYFKPVIIVGNWGLLKGKGITTDVYDLWKLDEAIKSALDNRIDPNKIKAFLFSVKESMFEGSAVAKSMDYEKVAGSIIKRYQELKGKLC